MLFIENKYKKKTEKKRKNTFRTLVGVHLRTYIAFHGISLSVKPVDQQQRQLAVRFYSWWYHKGSGVGVSARRIASAMNRFYAK